MGAAAPADSAAPHQGHKTSIANSSIGVVRIGDQNNYVNNYYGAVATSVQELVSGYLSAVRQWAPDPLLGRDDEVAAMRGFCRGDEPYLWWRAAPWSGKTALLAWFALHPPDDVEVVCFFIRAAIATESDYYGYVLKMLPQLARLSERPPSADWSGAGSADLYHYLLNDAAEKLGDHGKRLVLIVDGLDEDSGSTSIISQLPARPHRALRIILASRDSPDITEDLAPDHPLRSLNRTVLAPFPHARGIERLAKNELRELLTGQPEHRDLIGLITAAQGALTVADLAELTGQDGYDVEAVLSGRAGRVLTPHATRTSDGLGDPGYVLAHEELRQQARGYLAKRLPEYCRQLHDWADVYARNRWAASTPMYLLLEYPSLLRELGESDRLYALVTDESRQARLFEHSAGDSVALAEITAALEFFVDAPQPDLAKICLLARHRDTLTSRNQDVPIELLRGWVYVGRLNRALATAHSKADTDERDEALTSICYAVAEMGDVDRAEALARSFSGARSVAWALGAIARAVAQGGDLDRATAIAETIRNDDYRSEALATLAQVAAEAGDADRATILTDAITDEAERVVALAEIAATLARAGDIRRAIGLAECSEQLTAEITATDQRDNALFAMACALAEAGQIVRAETFAQAVIDPIGSAAAFAAIAKVLARAGDVAAAQKLATGMLNKIGRALVNIAIAEGLAQGGDIDAAQAVAQNLHYESKLALDAVARVAAETGNLDRVEALTGPWSDALYEAAALTNLATIAAKAGDTDRAVELANRADALEEDRGGLLSHQKAVMLSSIAEVLATTGNVSTAADFAARAESMINATWVVSELDSDDEIRGTAIQVARAGDFELAEALACCTIVDDDDTLHEIAKVAARRGDWRWARRLAGDDPYALYSIGQTAVKEGRLEVAEAIAGIIPDTDWKKSLLTNMARAAAYTGNYDGAESYLQASGDEGQVHLWMARFAAECGDLDRAQARAYAITDGDTRAETLALLAQKAELRGDLDAAVRFADAAERCADATTGEYRALLVDLIAIAARAQDGDLCRRLANQVQRLVHSIEDYPDRAAVLAAAGVIAAQTGNADSLQALVGTMDKRDVGRAVAVAAHVGDITCALAIADTVGDPDDRAMILSDAAQNLAQIARGAVGAIARQDVERAESLADMTRGDEQIAALISIIEAAAQTGDIERAKRLAAAIPPGSDDRDRALSAIAQAAARGNDVDDAAAFAHAIDDDAGRARTLAGIAETAASSGNIDRAVELALEAYECVTTDDDEDDDDDDEDDEYMGVMRQIAETLVGTGDVDYVEELAYEIDPSSDRRSAQMLVELAAALATAGNLGPASRLLPRAWLGAPWAAPLKVLRVVDPRAAEIVAAEIRANARRSAGGVPVSKNQMSHNTFSLRRPSTES
jgi:tetratricopeptide (TPR) repeat protein